MLQLLSKKDNVNFLSSWIKDDSIEADFDRKLIYSNKLLIEYNTRLCHCYLPKALKNCME